MSAILTATLFEGLLDGGGGLNPVGAVNFAIVLVGALSGVVALLKSRERSWAVWLSAVLFGLILVFELISWAIPGD